ncbi:MAG: N-acetyl-gamma-glutamyl-phosphate reductase [Candidatus Brocadiia bacterium]|jgi:N-acetyl-gamma-glutamyl-phosphate reductase|nr:N-acetyl-gamma-glutamyl-phosphate reductase [Candidatus Brocadiia bacterium]
MPLKISIVGATAYTSYELIRILLRHPEARIVHLATRREGNPAASDIFPALRGLCDMRMTGMEPEAAPERPDVAFFTLPHLVSQQHVPKYLDAGIRCIDFSADYRFDDPATYREHYGPHEDAGNLERAVYGIPELFREQVRGADLVANPGCYPTSALLGLAPLLKGGLLEEGGIIVNSVSGVSGRGNKPNAGSMFCACNENAVAYKVGAHRHEPEMAHGLRLLGARAPDVLFVPHLVPMDRGILSTVYVRLTAGTSAEELRDLYAAFYAGERFVRVLPQGEQPRTKDVALTNLCDIAVVPVRGGRAVITSAIDNLMRGASSQAVQNMNVAFGLDEAAGIG